MDFVALLEQQLCQVGAVLTGDTGDHCLFHLSTSVELKIWEFLSGVTAGGRNATSQCQTCRAFCGPSCAIARNATLLPCSQARGSKDQPTIANPMFSSGVSLRRRWAPTFLPD